MTGLDEDTKEFKRKYMREYMRKYRKNNPEKIKAINERFWEKKARQENCN